MHQSNHALPRQMLQSRTPRRRGRRRSPRRARCPRRRRSSRLPRRTSCWGSSPPRAQRPPCTPRGRRGLRRRCRRESPATPRSAPARTRCPCRRRRRPLRPSLASIRTTTMHLPRCQGMAPLMRILTLITTRRLRCPEMGQPRIRILIPTTMLLPRCREMTPPRRTTMRRRTSPRPNGLPRRCLPGNPRRRSREPPKLPMPSPRLVLLRCRLVPAPPSSPNHQGSLRPPLSRPLLPPFNLHPPNVRAEETPARSPPRPNPGRGRGRALKSPSLRRSVPRLH